MEAESATSTEPKKRRGRPVTIDWAAVERDFLTGNFTHRQLSHKHGVSIRRLTEKSAEKKWRERMKLPADEVVFSAQKMRSADVVANKRRPLPLRPELSAAEFDERLEKHREIFQDYAHELRNLAPAEVAPLTHTALSLAELQEIVLNRHRRRLTEMQTMVEDAQAKVATVAEETRTPNDAARYVNAVCGLVTATKALIDMERTAYCIRDDEQVTKLNDTPKRVRIDFEDAKERGQGPEND